jgi:hypothetical protein
LPCDSGPSSDDSPGGAGEVPGTDGGRRKKPAAELPGSIDFIFLRETMEFPWPIEIDGLPIKHGDFPWLCEITRWYTQYIQYIYIYMYNIV